MALKLLFFIILCFLFLSQNIFAQDSSNIKFVSPQIIEETDTSRGIIQDTSLDTPKSGDDDRYIAKSLPDSVTLFPNEPPMCINYSEVMKMIEYPWEGYEAEGKVIARLLVGLNGGVTDVAEIKGPQVFYKEVKRVCMLLKFKAAHDKGKPVNCLVTVPFTFKLSK